MTKTRLEGWSEEEYRQWSAQHPDEAETCNRNRINCEQVRMDFESKSPKITGYAAVFNKETELWPGFIEQVAPGAFTKTIKADDVRALVDHESSKILGRNTAGTLRLWEDSKGLGYEVLSGGDRTYENDLIKSIKRGDINQSSIGFNIVEQSLKYDKGNDMVRRTLTEVKLFDVSAVTFPAYSSTEVHVRMNRNEGLGKDEVIEISDSKSDINTPSDEELFKRFEALKCKACET
jgi:uncharacterized protein